MSPAAVLDRVTGGRGVLAVKYSMVSVIGVSITQLLLAIFVDLLRHNPTWSNVAAVMLTAVPVFFLNKLWVWSADGKVSLRREVLPFWVFTAAGLLLSTGLVALADDVANGNTLLVKLGQHHRIRHPLGGQVPLPRPDHVRPLRARRGPVARGARAAPDRT